MAGVGGKMRKCLAAAEKSENSNKVYRCHKAGNEDSRCVIITCIFPIRVDGSLVLNGTRPDESCMKLHSVKNPLGKEGAKCLRDYIHACT